MQQVSRGPSSVTLGDIELAADGAIVDGTDSNIKAAVLDLTGSDALAVAIVDGDGAQISSFGGGTQYTEGDTDASITGTALLMEGAADTLVVAPGTAADGLLVNLGANNDVTVSGVSTAAKQDTLIAATDGIEGLLTTIDGDTGVLAGAVSGSEMQVDIVSAPTITVANAGLTELAAAINGSSQMDVNLAASAATVTVANAGLTELAAAINASSQLDVNIAASGATVPVSNAGLTALNGAITGNEVQVDVLTLPALAAGTNNIGDVDVLSLPALPAGNNNIGDVDVASVTGNVTVVQGTGSNLHTVVDSGTITTVSTVSALGVSTTGPMKAEDVAHATGDMGIPAWAVAQTTPNAAYGATGDYTPISVTTTGAVRTAPISEDFAVLANGPQVKKYYTNAGAVTDGIVWSPAAGARWYVTDIFIGVSAAATVTLEDDLSGGDSPVFKMEFSANSGWSHKFETPLFSGEDAADLIVTTSAGNVYITITGYEI
jgi:hypothetical protein